MLVHCVFASAHCVFALAHCVFASAHCVFASARCVCVSALRFCVSALRFCVSALRWRWCIAFCVSALRLRQRVFFASVLFGFLSVFRVFLPYYYKRKDYFTIFICSLDIEVLTCHFNVTNVAKVFREEQTF